MKLRIALAILSLALIASCKKEPLQTPETKSETVQQDPALEKLKAENKALKEALDADRADLSDMKNKLALSIQEKEKLKSDAEKEKETLKKGIETNRQVIDGAASLSDFLKNEMTVDIAKYGEGEIRIIKTIIENLSTPEGYTWFKKYYADESTRAYLAKIMVIRKIDWEKGYSKRYIKENVK